ncbi:MAG: TetR/AcrR family transcriptional regulator [Chloroflexota bacterium]
MTTATDRMPYHHGDLRNALVSEATALARVGGPDAVVLREAARRVGVSPSAAYRHFPSLEALLAAVASRAREALGRAMLERLASLPRERDSRRAALARFRATGAAYIDFALTEPGLFRVAFVPCDPVLLVRDDPSPYAILSEAIDAVAASGALPRGRRPHAEEVAWSAVHGVAVLIGDGLMDLAGERDRADVIDRVLDGVAFGLTGRE